MLQSLKIENIALVTKVELAFERGLTVLTGETGAGKSVVVTALGLALGDRADRDQIRNGESRACVEAVFDISGVQGQYRKDFADYLIDNRLAIQREIFATGVSKVKINGEVSTLARLRELTAPLAEILSQHANQMLMHEENHLYFLDHFAALDDLREEVSTLFHHWEQAEKNLERLTRERERLTRERELLLFQKAEIDNAHVEIGEEDKLIHEKKILDSARSLMEYAEAVRNLLDGEEGSTLTCLRQARRQFEKMAEIDDSLDEQVKEFADIDYRLEELRQFVEKYGSSLQDNPARLDDINERLKELYELKRKYGGSEEAVLETLKTINTGLADRPDVDDQMSEVEKECRRLREEYSEKALSLTSVRRKAAEYLQKLVVKELNELAIDAGGFEFEFLYQNDDNGICLDNSKVKPREFGLEQGRFLFSANPGEPLKSLVKTASGGEISRVLLALKAAEKKNNNLRHSLLVFDEVDTGIGGHTANEVARKLKNLAASCQVLVITHLHQIARLADAHLVAQKLPQVDARSTITVSPLDDTGVQAELARMVALPEEA